MRRGAKKEGRIFAISVAILCLAPSLSHAYKVPLESVFRRVVGISELVVVGHVSDTEPYDRKVKERVSYILVEEVVYGDCKVVEKLKVNWYADKWFPGCVN